jgi:formylglycine-generating enzyme required for sulfatase activity
VEKEQVKLAEGRMKLRPALAWFTISVLASVAVVLAFASCSDPASEPSSTPDGSAYETGTVSGGDAGGPAVDASTKDSSTPDASDVSSDGSVLDSAADAAPPGPASCRTAGDGRTNCGDSGAESCCTSLAVDGGTFDRTYTNSGAGATGLADPATVSSFRLDEYEVTVGRYRAFVGAALLADGGAAWTPPVGSGKHTHLSGGLGLSNVQSAGTYEQGWNAADNVNVAPTNANLACDAWATWTPVAGANEKKPINCVSWFEALAFCIWDGGFLPSGSEWEYAAAGGSEQREYPWGSTDPGTANQYAIYGGGGSACYYPSGTLTACSGSPTNFAPVGAASLGGGRWGQLDLGGNVNEWNLDWDTGYVSPCTDGAYLTSGTLKQEPGGAMCGDTTYILPPTRNASPATLRNGGIGFRCARAP